MIAWLALAAMGILAGLFFALPLWRAGRTEEDVSALDLYRDQLAELEADRARGMIGETEARAARIEIERRILNTAEALPLKVQPRRLAAALTMIVAPAAALGLYAVIGAPGLPDAPFAERVPEAGAERSEIGPLLARLEGRLREDPGNGEGWMLLGQAYRALGRSEAAVEAFSRAHSLLPESAEAAVLLGESLTIEAGGQVTPKALAAFEAALALPGFHPSAGYFLGLAAMQAGDAKAAYERWRDLAAKSPKGAPYLEALQEAMDAAAAQIGAPSESASELAGSAEASN